MFQTHLTSVHPGGSRSSDDRQPGKITARRGMLALAVGALGLALGAPPANAVSTAVEFDTIHIKSVGQSLNKEYIEVANDSGRARSLAGWTLRDRHGNTYTFSSTKIPADSEARVYSGKGSDTARKRYWGATSSVWSKSGDTATLRDASGNKVTSCTYKSGKHVVHCD
jgi:hypothetical protein